MAQTGYTPILIYSSTTAAQAPSAGSLTNSTLGSELAINITDGKLFYKDNANAVQVIGWKTVPTTAGGTGLTSYTAGDLPYYATGTTLSKLAIGTNGQILTSTGTAPQWTTLSGVAVTSISFGTTGLTPATATQGAVTVAGTLITTNGGTGLSSYTAGDLTYYASGTTLTQLAIGASGRWLGSSGTAPQWNAPAALTKTDDTNVTLTLGGSASTALLNAASLTLGWTGTLAVSRGGTGTGTAFTSGSVVFAGASGVYSQDNANLFWDDSNNRLGIGQTAPLGVLHISANTDQTSLPSIVLQDSGTTATRLATITNISGDLRLSATSSISSLAAYISIQDDGTIILNTNNGDRLTASLAGNVTVNTGNLIIGTSGKGIDFSVTPGTGTSELLADYEEGTWTPTITGSTSAGTGTYTTQIGRYVKIGSMVYCQAYILWTNHTGTGNLWLTGLPYTLFTTTDNHPSGSIGLLSNVALTAGNIATTYGSPNTTRFNLVQYPTGGGAASSVPIDTAGEIIYSVCYYAA